MMELCEFDFEPVNADKKVSSLDQFLSYMNEEDTLTVLQAYHSFSLKYIYQYRLCFKIGKMTHHYN